MHYSQIMQPSLALDIGMCKFTRMDLGNSWLAFAPFSGIFGLRGTHFKTFWVPFCPEISHFPSEFSHFGDRFAPKRIIFNQFGDLFVQKWCTFSPNRAILKSVLLENKSISVILETFSSRNHPLSLRIEPFWRSLCSKINKFQSLWRPFCSEMMHFQSESSHFEDRFAREPFIFSPSRLGSGSFSVRIDLAFTHTWSIPTRFDIVFTRFGPVLYEN